MKDFQSLLNQGYVKTRGTRGELREAPFNPF